MIEIFSVKTITTWAVLSAIVLSGCSKSGGSDQPVKRDTTFEYLLTTVNFYNEGNLLVTDSFDFDQNGMIRTAFYYDKGQSSPKAIYGVTVDQNSNIIAFNYTSHESYGGQFTKFDVGYNAQNKVSSMVPETGGTLSAQDYQVHFTYGQNSIIYNAFGIDNLFDTLIYSNGNLMHRQHYGSNATTGSDTSTTMDYFYSSYKNPFYNVSLANMAGLFMKCPADGAGREYDYLADVLSTNLPDHIKYSYGPSSRPLQWGIHTYTWKTDTSGRTISGDLVFNDSTFSNPGAVISPYVVHYSFDFSFKQYMVIR